MSDDRNSAPPTGLERTIRLSHAALAGERLARAFWPLWVVVAATVAALALGAVSGLSDAGLTVAGVLVVSAGGAALWHGLRALRWPGRGEAIDRLDARLSGQPVATLFDRQALGRDDDASASLWRAHMERMAERARAARAGTPDPALARRDRAGLRLVALTLLLAALMFGSGWRGVGDLDAALPDAPGIAQAAGPAWEGWVEAPAYTGEPSLYLNEISGTRIEAPEGALVTLRLYGGDGALSVRESVSAAGPAGPAGEAPADDELTSRRFTIAGDGEIAVEGAGGRAWQVVARPDAPPEIAFDGDITRTGEGELRLPFAAQDDYGVESAEAVVRLDPARVERSHGLSRAPGDHGPLELSLPMPTRGDRGEIAERLSADLSRHVFAGLPVTVSLRATDGADQTAESGARRLTLPGRRFFQPMARAIVEQRRDLLWTTDNAPRVARILRAISTGPEDIFRDSGNYMALRGIVRDLESAMDDGAVADRRPDLAGALWELALEIEEGSLDDAKAALDRARERLSEAMRSGASDEEIRRLMEEYRQAMRDYMSELARRGEQGQDRRQADGQSRELGADQMSEMMDRIEELMREGRMEEAQRLLDMLGRMTDNMRVTEGEGGGQGQQSMEDLSETLRDQQRLSDDAFGELQRRFGGQQDGQGSAQGRPDGQQGSGGAPRPGSGAEGVEPDGQSLSERQRALREELQRQREALPGLGGEDGDATEEALDRAGRAMDRAETSLREGDLSGALDEQAEALEALREGMRNLSRSLAQRQGQQNGRGRAATTGEDPMGRQRGQGGAYGADDEVVSGEEARRRAEELRDEIRERSSDRSRPEEERDYLERLLDPF